MNKKFDFSEIDEALPAAEKMQEQDCISTHWKTIMKLYAFLVLMWKSSKTDFRKSCPKWTGLFLPYEGQARSQSARKTLEQEGEKICRKMVDRMESLCPRLAGRLSVNDRVFVSVTAFWCMVEAIISLAAAFVCTCTANARPIHNTLLWEILGCTIAFLVVCVVLTIFICHKLKL